MIHEPIIVPAENMQAEADDAPAISIRFGLGLLVLAAVMIGAHLLWLSAGMPSLSQIMEALNA